MPCTDGGPSPMEEAAERRAVTAEQRAFKMVEAMLCALMSMLEEQTFSRKETFSEALDRIDFKEAGVSRKEFELWWAKHKEADAKRLQREAGAAQRDAQKKLDEQARKEALAKLTPRERRLLKVKA